MIETSPSKVEHNSEVGGYTELNNVAGLPPVNETGKAIESGIELSEFSRFTPDEVNTTLDNLLRSVVPQEKLSKGFFRGAIVPLAAGLLGSVSGSSIANAALGTLEQVAMPVLKALHPPGVAAVGAFAGSIATSFVRRLLCNESLFAYYAKYSHTDSRQLQPGLKVADTLYKWYTRGIEKNAFTHLFCNLKSVPSAVNKVSEHNTSEDPLELEPVSMSKEAIAEVMRQGLFYLLSTKASIMLGAELSEDELKLITANEEQVTAALSTVMKKIPDGAERQAILLEATKRVKFDETFRYYLAAFTMAGVSSGKAIALGGVFGLVWQLMPGLVQSFSGTMQEALKANPVQLPQLAPLPQQLPNFEQQMAQGFNQLQETLSVSIQRAEALIRTIGNAFLGHTNQAEIPATIPANTHVVDIAVPTVAHASEMPFTVDSAHMAPSVMPMTAAAEATPAATAQIPFVVDGLSNARAPLPVEISMSTKGLEVTPPRVEIPHAVVGADTSISEHFAVLPQFDLHGVTGDAATVPIENVVANLMLVAEVNPELLQAAIITVSESDPELAAQLAQLVPVGSSPSQLVSAIESMLPVMQQSGPMAVYGIRKLAQALICAMSIGAGSGAACPALAGP